VICEQQPTGPRSKPAFSRELLAGLRWSLVACALASAGCSALRLTGITATQQKPSNVAVYFKVENAAGDPIPNLSAENFRIFEDGQLVSSSESQQTLLDPDTAAAHYTLLLVDMSGKVIAGGDNEVIPQAVSAFTVRVERHERVAIYAFDGSENIYPVVPFTPSEPRGSARAGARQLATFKPKDPSTNLNGAVVKALDELSAALGRANQALRFGTLVVVAEGADRASRVSTPDMERRVRESPFDVYAVGLGGTTTEADLKGIGKNGVAMAADRDAILKALDDVGTKIESRAKSYYLVSYCSPARAGRHDVRVEAAFKDSEGDKSGSFDSHFDATGFAPGCDPSAPPTFESNFDPTRRDGIARSQDDDKRTVRAAPKAAPKPPKSGTTNTAESLPPPPPPGQQEFVP
jgi:hypothetical protein